MSPVREFSYLRSLGYICFGDSHDPADCWFVLYTAYYDASGSQADPVDSDTPPVIVVAALVSTEKKWLHFERDWTGLLSSSGVGSFHMADFVAARGEFEDWNNQQRKDFAAEAVRIIKVRTNQPLACGIPLSAYAEVDRDYLLSEVYGANHPRSGAYAVCAGLCHARVEEWLRTRKPGRRFAHVFERGDMGQGALIRQLEVRKSWKPVSILAKHDPETGDRVRQFEAVDFLAWHFRNGYREYLSGKVNPSAMLHEIFTQLPITDGNEGCFDGPGLRGYCEKLHGEGLLPKRSGSAS